MKSLLQVKIESQLNLTEANEKIKLKDERIVDLLHNPLNFKI